MRASRELSPATRSKTGTQTQNPISCVGWCSDVFRGVKEIGSGVETPSSLSINLEMELK